MSSNLYDKNNDRLIPYAGSAKTSSLDEVDDVEINSPTDGQVLRYDETNNQWINADPSPALPDAEPTEDSLNYVTSGGLYTKFQDVNEDINEIGSSLQTLTNSVISDVYEVTTPAFSSLPQTFTAQGITANHNLVVDGYAKLSNPSALGSDWTVTTGANTVTISGTFSGSTATTVTMTLGVKRAITATA